MTSERMCVCSVAKSCPTLCDTMDCSLPGSSVHGIFQARILEWVAISSSRASPFLRLPAQNKVQMKLLSSLRTEQKQGEVTAFAGCGRKMNNNCFPSDSQFSIPQAFPFALSEKTFESKHYI